MAAGTQTSQSQINQAAGTIATGLRDLFNKVDILNAELGVIGTASLENDYGFTPADAATIVSAIGNLEALSQIYQGGAPGAALNYRANSQALWGTS
jgi:uncharacterized protein with beta-barrel porin domain